jgi:hypothetical protein
MTSVASIYVGTHSILITITAAVVAMTLMAMVLIFQR